MTQPTRGQLPVAYQLRVNGHLDQHWSPWFGDLTLTLNDDGTTSLTGAVTDQAELHGLLTKIRDLGIPLISVAIVDAPDSGAHQPTTPAAYQERGAHRAT
jgi:hypothetical protein